MTTVIKDSENKGENVNANFNANAVATQKRELTAEQKEKSARMDLEVRKSYRNFNMKDGEEFIIRTDLDKMEYKETEVFKGTGLRYIIQVVITDWDQFKEYTWKLAPKHGKRLKEVLDLGYNNELIRVKRNGSDMDTEYEFTPVSS